MTQRLTAAARAARLAVLAIVAMSAAACQSREADEADALGPEVGDPGPTHRPGQPCLACHSDRDDRGEKLFAVAGTIYEEQADGLGMSNVEVVITDAQERMFTVFTNEAGNFMIHVDPSLDAPEAVGDGELDVPEAPEFPLNVTIRAGAREQIMRNVVGREGSCAHCHSGPPGATSAGKIYLVDP